MFNSNLNSLIYLSLLIYTLQSIVLILNFLAVSAQKSKSLELYVFSIHNNNFKHLFYLLLLAIAGVPPFFLFFFKIMIVVKLAGSVWFLLLFTIINSVILYYYLNFLNKIKFLKNFKSLNKNLTFYYKFASALIHIITFNITSVFFIYYMFLF